MDTDILPTPYVDEAIKELERCVKEFFAQILVTWSLIRQVICTRQKKINRFILFFALVFL